jgi:hypothetical protein
MRGMASVPIRLRRLRARQDAWDWDVAIAQAAQDYGVDEAELRAEVQAWVERCRKYGPLSIDEVFARTAAELGIDELQLWAEVAQLMADRRNRP